MYIRDEDKSKSPRFCREHIPEGYTFGEEKRGICCVCGNDSLPTFVLVSDDRGIPVSIAEAQSYNRLPNYMRDLGPWACTNCISKYGLEVDLYPRMTIECDRCGTVNSCFRVTKKKE